MSVLHRQLLIAAAVLLHGCQCYNVLVAVLGMSGSQNLVMYRLADYLGERGHKVFVLKADLIPEAKSPRLRHATELKYTVIKDAALLDSMRAAMWAMPWQNETAGGDSVLGQIDMLRNGMVPMVQSMLRGCGDFLRADGGTGADADVHAALRSVQFDVALIHFMDMCAFGLAHRLRIDTTVLMSTGMLFESMLHYAGLPVESAYAPSPIMPHTDRMTFAERAKNELATRGMSLLFGLMESSYTDLMRQQYGDDFPDVAELGRSASLFFVNSDMNFEYPRPVAHNVRYVGGLTMEKPRPLDTKWTEVVARSGEAGLVIFSMGSVANTSAMPMAWKSVLLDSFATFADYTFVARLERPLPQRIPDNVVLADWLPQRDLMGNAKTRLLITHGGYNSITEASAAGVPVVAMPLFGDQHANVRRIERAGVGLPLDRDDLSVHTVTAAIGTVLNDARYLANARRLAAMIGRQPLKPLAEALDWIEFAAEFGPLTHMQLASRRMTFVEKHNADVYAALAGVLLAIAVGLCCLCRCACRWCCARGGKHKRD